MSLKKQFVGAGIVVGALALLLARYLPATKLQHEPETTLTQPGPPKAKAALNEAEQQADLDLALQKLAQRGLYVNTESRRCLQFFYDADDKQAIELSVRELHDDARNCPGDPNTAPIVARYRVARKSDEIAIYQVIEGDYKVLDQCDVLEYQAYSDSNGMTPVAAGNYRISASGPSYFHSAPAPQCKLAQSSLMPGDVIQAQHRYKQFTKVMYIHPQSREILSGWILSSSIQKR